MNCHKNKHIKQIVKILRKVNIKDIYLGILLKSFHLALPSILLFQIMFFSKPLAIIAFGAISIVSLLYLYFGNCFISIVENELLKNYKDLKDLNVVDPMLDLLNLEITSKNRKYISFYVFFYYYLVILIILYFRFFF